MWKNANFDLGGSVAIPISRVTVYVNMKSVDGLENWLVGDRSGSERHLEALKSI